MLAVVPRIGVKCVCAKAEPQDRGRRPPARRRWRRPLPYPHYCAKPDARGSSAAVHCRPANADADAAAPPRQVEKCEAAEGEPEVEGPKTVVTVILLAVVAAAIMAVVGCGMYLHHRDEK